MIFHSTNKGKQQLSIVLLLLLLLLMLVVSLLLVREEKEETAQPEHMQHRVEEDCEILAAKEGAF